MYSAHCDHTPVDGMVFVLYIAYMTNILLSCDGNWQKYKPNKLVSLSGVFNFNENILECVCKTELFTTILI